VHFQNPILLASGTAAYGREVAQVTNLEALGGLVTKAVSLERRDGAPAPRVAEFHGGMLNAVGLANPGVAEVRDKHLPWLASNLTRCRVVVNVVGYEPDQYARVVEALKGAAGIHAFELNLSCPNVKAGGLEFGDDPASAAGVVSLARAQTKLPLFVKLSPVVRKIGDIARAVEDAGADAITLVNTIPGMLVDIHKRKPALGFGSGGLSGPALLPVGVLATRRVSAAVALPLVGVGGVSQAEHALQYIMAGASLVAIGTASLRDPRVAERVAAGLGAWCASNGVASLSSLVGVLNKV
jgi:dihydroorotate dehydrogenase (NAD+) catalytic subunit